MNDAFEDVASWSIPQDPSMESKLEKLCLSGHPGYLGGYSIQREGLQNLITCQWLQTSSLVELCLEFHSYLDMMVLELIFAMMHNHLTLKIVRLECLYVHHTNLGCVIQMVTETVRVCQLQLLHLEIHVDYDDNDDDSDDDSVEKEDSSPDYDTLLQAFAANTTLTDVVLSYDILEDIQTSDRKKLNFYGKRNEAFQKIMSNLTMGGTDRNDPSNDDADDEFHVDDDSRQVRGCCGDSNSTAIPLGFWPHILEAAHVHFLDLSMLHHLLSSQTVGLVLSGREEKDDVSFLLPCFVTSTNKNAQSRCPNTKRDHGQISSE
jgi:hypothetical protein